MQLAESTWTDADAVETDLALLPVGSTEQHGPHAPLGTDALTAEAVAAAGADAYDGEVVVAPTIPVGVAAEHRRFAGTLWVSADTFRDYVGETVDSLVAHGWDRVVLVNGHGGNVGPLREVCAARTRESDAYAVPFTWFDAVSLDAGTDDGAGDGDDGAGDGDDGAGDGDDGAGDGDDGNGTPAPPVDLSEIAMGHGGAVETSLVRALAPELVREERLAGASEGAADGWGEFHEGVNLAYDTDEFSENGAVGDPGASDPELGEWLQARAAERLASLLDRVATRER